MATAKVFTSKETKTVEVDVKRIELSLTENEAQTVRDILATVGGPISSSRRKHTENVLCALSNAGVQFRGFSSDLHGKLNFSD